MLKTLIKMFKKSFLLTQNDFCGSTFALQNNLSNNKKAVLF
jgi:hypothetical protein